MSDKLGDNCPICETKWKITTFGAKIWKDCLECGDTAENLIAKASKNTRCPLTSQKYDGADWIWEEDRGTFPLDPNSGWSDDDEWGDIPFLVEVKKNPSHEELEKAMKKVTENQLLFGTAMIRWV